ncbi:MAG TPA: thioredoxin [Candidatus Dormibacteraeota bacterium]
MGTIPAVTDADFQARVLEADRPVLVDFWATWCAPCRMIAPVVDELSAEFGDRIRILKMDIDANPQTPGQLGIMSVPTVIIFKDGRPAERTVGYRSNLKSDLKLKLDSLL